MPRCATVVFFFLVIAFYQPSVLQAQDLENISVCIDPGEAAYMNSYNQELDGQSELHLNLMVAAYLKTYLALVRIDTVIITFADSSRRLALSACEDVANDNGVDWFHSIRHNAGETKQRNTILVTGNQVTPLLNEVKTMGEIMGKQLWQACRTSGYLVRSFDRYFNRRNGINRLGFWQNLQMPGEIALASYYDQPAEKARLSNTSYLRLEALALFKSLLQYYQADSLSFATFSGFIMDAETGIPVNNATVQLSSLDSSSTTDLLNNGFYAFLELPPGRYQVKVAAAGYESQTDSVTVLANEFNFLDFTLYSILPPTIRSVQPEKDQLGFSPYGVINLEFSRAMNVHSVAAALRVQPEFEFQLTWQDQNTKLYIDPKPVLQFNTTYRLTLDAIARDQLNHPLDGNDDGYSGDTFELSFTTAPVNFSLPQVLATQPVDQDTGIFIGDLIRIELNKPVHQAALDINNIILQGSNQRKIKANSQIRTTPSGRCFLTITPSELLSPKTRYTVALQKTLTDSNGIGMDQNFTFHFVTQKSALDYVIIDDFNGGLNNWLIPMLSPRSQNIDLKATQWDSAAVDLRDNGLAARLNYHLFAEGLLDFTMTGHTVNSGQLMPGDMVGAFLNGDSSRCQFRFYFYDQLNNLFSAPWTTIDWYGWQKISFRLDYDSLTTIAAETGFINGDLSLAGFQIASDQEIAGTLLFDDCFKVSLPVPLLSSLRAEMKLEKPLLVQSYPNPFSTKLNHSSILISYQIPVEMSASQVNLAIFNTLGQQVRELVSQTLSPGRYEVFWDVMDESQQHLPAGVYFYRLQIGERVQTRRLVILN